MKLPRVKIEVIVIAFVVVVYVCSLLYSFGAIDTPTMILIIATGGFSVVAIGRSRR